MKDNLLKKQPNQTGHIQSLPTKTVVITDKRLGGEQKKTALITNVYTSAKWLLRNAKGLPVLTFLLLFALIGLCFLIFAPGLGTRVGEATGSVAGYAVGSYEGVTKGIAAGNEAGKEVGLSAEDTTVKIKTDLVDTGKLEVLVAGVKLSNHHNLGDDYATLYILKGNAVFTVDLSQAVVSFGNADSEIIVVVPEPEMNLYIDESATQKLAEYQKHIYAGNAEDGFNAYLNTMKKTVEDVQQALGNYDSLMAQAKTAAQKQIELLVKSARGDAISISVNFFN